MNADLIKINKNGWNLSQIFWNNLNFYEKSFLKLELSSYKTKKIYRSRIGGDHIGQLHASKPKLRGHRQ